MDRLGVPLIRAVPDYVIDGDDIIILVEGQEFCAFSIENFERGAKRAASVIARHRRGTFPREMGAASATLN
jgi:hypothetical protein